MISFISLQDDDSSHHSLDDQNDLESQLYGKIHHSSQENFDNQDNIGINYLLPQENNEKTFSYGERYRTHNTPKYNKHNLSSFASSNKNFHNILDNNNKEDSSPSTSNDKYKKKNYKLESSSKKKRNKHKEETIKMDQNSSIKNSSHDLNVIHKRKHYNEEINMVEDILNKNFGENSNKKISSYIINCENYLKNKKIKYTPSPIKLIKEASSINKKDNIVNINNKDDIMVVYDKKSHQSKNENIIMNIDKPKKKEKKTKHKNVKSKFNKINIKKFINLGRKSCAKSWSDEMREFYRDSWCEENYDMDHVKNSMRDNSILWQLDPADLGLVRPKYNPYKNKRCFNCFQYNHINEFCPEAKKNIICEFCGLEGHRRLNCKLKICEICLNWSEHHYSKDISCKEVLICPICLKDEHIKEYCPLYKKLLNGADDNLCISCPNCAGAHIYEQCPLWYEPNEPYKKPKRKKSSKQHRARRAVYYNKARKYK